MFRSLLHLLAGRFAEEIDYLLAADFDFDDVTSSDPERAALAAESAVRYHREHPHRAQLSRRRGRRPGRTPAAPSHCITPVQSSSQRRRFGSRRSDFDRI
jgi:hypothetical protein